VDDPGIVGLESVGLDSVPKVPLFAGKPVGLVGMGFIGAPGAVSGLAFCPGRETFGDEVAPAPVGE